MITSRTFLLALFATLFTLGYAAPASTPDTLARRQDFNFSPLGVANPESAPPTSNAANIPGTSNIQNPPSNGGPSPPTTPPPPTSPPANPPASPETQPPTGGNPPPESNSNTSPPTNPPSNDGTYQPPNYYNPGYGYGEHGHQGMKHHNYGYN